MKDSTIYIYVGEGLGVPGLPHRITPAEAEALGVAELFKAAIENGSYEPETAKAAVESVTGTAKTVGGRQFGEQSTPSTTSGQALSTSKGGAPGKKNVTEE